MAAYGELTFAPLPSNYNRSTGQFLKGHTPHNKGKKWSEWMSKRGQKKVMKGWRNILEKRPHSRPDNRDRCAKKCVCIDAEGKWKVYDAITDAAIANNLIRENIKRACRNNAAHRVNKITGKVNTDFKCGGLRWYYEDDEQWIKKAKL